MGKYGENMGNYGENMGKIWGKYGTKWDKMAKRSGETKKSEKMIGAMRRGSHPKIKCWD
jgi:hypothetical protein